MPSQGTSVALPSIACIGEAAQRAEIGERAPHWKTFASCSASLNFKPSICSTMIFTPEAMEVRLLTLLCSIIGILCKSDSARGAITLSCDHCSVCFWIYRRQTMSKQLCAHDSYISACHCLTSRHCSWLTLCCCFHVGRIMKAERLATQILEMN